MSWGDNGDGQDPWERKQRQTPPDLDELLNNLSQKLGGLFGKPKVPLNGDGDNRGRGKKTGSFLILILFLWALSGFYIVSENERGVILRFGQYQRTTMPGPGWHLPYPIETAEIVNFTGIRSVEKRTTMLTEDENIVELAFSVQYRVNNAENYLFKVETPDIEGDRTCRFTSTICGVLNSAIRDIVGKNKMDYILGEGRSEIPVLTGALIQDVLDNYESGLEVVTVNLQDSQPPNQVQEAFQDATKAREDMVRFQNEAEAYANDILPVARGAAARAIQDSLAYRDQVIANSTGEAKRFTQLLQEYKKAPNVTRKRLYIDTVESVMENSSKVLLDISKGNNLMVLPLSDLLSKKLGDEVRSIPNDEGYRTSEETQATDEMNQQRESR